MMLPSEDWWLSRRWFAAKSRQITGTGVFDQAQLSSEYTLYLVEVSYASGAPELYAVPMNADGNDAVEDPAYQRLLLDLLSDNAAVGPVHFETYHQVAAAEPWLLGVEQSNTSVAYGRELILKNIRRVEFGCNRDVEVGRFLADQAHFPHTPQVAGAITYEGRGTATLGVLQRFVENQGDCWKYVLGHLTPPPNAPDDVFWAQDALPDGQEALLADIEHLGRVTGELHVALASRRDVPDFAPEPASGGDVQAWLADAQRQLSEASAFLGPEKAAACTQRLDDLAAVLPLGDVRKIQIHGDYHLGQALKTADGFAIIDFEGEPARPLDERRAKQPALRDVAGMLRSLNYAANTAGVPSWAASAAGRFLIGWQSMCGEADPRLITFFQLAKALYELNYELNNRPTWAHVPLDGIEHLMADG